MQNSKHGDELMGATLLLQKSHKNTCKTKPKPRNWELKTKHRETKDGDFWEHNRRNPHSIKG